MIMIKKTNILLCCFAVFMAISSCKKTPGQGGNASIKGVLWLRNYDPFFTIVKGRYPAINKTVYLFFGDDTSPGTSVNTNENGEFEFKYLRKGKYRVIFYSTQYQSTNTTPNVFPVEHLVELAKRKEVKDIGLDTING